MGQASNLLAAGFAVVRSEFQSTITKGAVSKYCVAADLAEVKEMQDAGYETMFERIVELSTTDFVSLGIVHHDTVTVDARQYHIAMIHPDATDPCVRLGLKSIR